MDKEQKIKDLVVKVEELHKDVKSLMKELSYHKKARSIRRLDQFIQSGLRAFPEYTSTATRVNRFKVENIVLPVINKDLNNKFTQHIEELDNKEQEHPKKRRGRPKKED